MKYQQIYNSNNTGENCCPIHSCWRNGVLLLSVIAASFGLINTSYATDIYKCKATDGSMHFQEMPCGEKSMSVKINKSTTANSKKKSAERSGNQEFIADQLQRERMLIKEQNRQKNAHKSQAKRNCTGESDKLTRLMNTDKIYTIDDNGNRVYMNQHQRRQSINKQRQRAEYWCKKAGQ